MADHVRKQIRDAAVTALTGLTTSGSHVFNCRPDERELQDGDLPGLRIYTRDGDSRPVELGVKRRRLRHVELVVECCSKKTSNVQDELDTMIKEVETALDAVNAIPAAKSVEPSREEIDLGGAAEKDIGVARLTFVVEYHTARGAPDVAL